MRTGLPVPHAREDGFSLLETLVSISIVSIVMASVATFYVQTLAAVGKQRDVQTATQLAVDATERLRALQGTAVTAGRDEDSVGAQWQYAKEHWATPVSGVVDPLGQMAQAWDGSAVDGSGPTAVLPTVGRANTVNGTTFTQNWYVGKCWQLVAGGACTETAPPAVSASLPPAAPTMVAFFRVVVAVTWPGRDCPANGCVYSLSTLINNASEEPTFNANAQAVAPRVVNPLAQVGDVTVPVTMQMASDGGALPVIWTAVGLPTGLTITPSGLISGTPTTVGTYTVTVGATDAFSLTGTAAFTWVISALPVVTNPGPVTTAGGVPSLMALTVVGGTSPMAWTATAPGGWGVTGLPPGLTLDTATGLIGGTPSKAGSFPVTVTVTDNTAQKAATTFTWTVPALTLQTPAAQAAETTSTNTALQVVAAGGVLPYTWSTVALPPGLTINSAGLVTGSPTTVGTYATKVTVTDASGVALTTTAISWKITAGPKLAGLTTPRTNPVGTALAAINPTASLGNGVYTWTASGLPPGVVISSTTGQITGTPTAGTYYLTTVTVTDTTGANAKYTFEWNVPNPAALQITFPLTGNFTLALNGALSVASTATGGSLPYTWSSVNMPPGLVVSSTGVISGKPTVKGTYTTYLTVKDNINRVATVMGVVSVV
jgi:prepilin-type N-terminal cleavage/methylation domain-containing protein